MFSLYYILYSICNFGYFPFWLKGQDFSFLHHFWQLLSFYVICRCYSNVGRVGGEQELSLAGPCLKKGTAIHELMHALGFWHEQSRPDRDFWVQIIESNIQTGTNNVIMITKIEMYLSSEDCIGCCASGIMLLMGVACVLLSCLNIECMVVERRLSV